MASSLPNYPTDSDTNTFSSTMMPSDDHDMYSPMSPSFASDLVEARDSESVPPTHKNRTLILCFDGTGKVCSRIHCLKLISYLSGDQFDDDVNFHLFPASTKLILFYSRIQILSISFLSWGRMTVRSNSSTIRCVLGTLHLITRVANMLHTFRPESARTLSPK